MSLLDDIPADGQVHKRDEMVPVWWIRCPCCGDASGYPSFGSERGREESEAWLEQHQRHCTGQPT